MLKEAISYICSNDNNFSRRDVLIETLKNAEKQARFDERLTFLCECRRSQVYPNFIDSLLHCFKFHRVVFSINGGARISCHVRLFWCL